MFSSGDMHDVYARDLDLNLLRVFAVVAEEGSITRAAARLYVTQPAVSAALRRLATFMDAELFVRQGRGVALTTRGAELAAVARTHLGSLVAGTMAPAVFDPLASTATVRIGLADGMEALLLPGLVAHLRSAAPGMQLIVRPVQFRTVEAALLANEVDLAVSVADELPKSIRREAVFKSQSDTADFVCLYDSRQLRLPKVLTEREYFDREHVIVSYAGDLRGVVEDALGKTRKVRVSVSAFGHVADVVDGSQLLATVPYFIAAHIGKTRPHLLCKPLPFTFGKATLELLWTRRNDDDAVVGFVRGVVIGVARSLHAPARAKAASHKRRS